MNLNDGNLILGGYYIGIIKSKDWTFSIKHDDKIPEIQRAYLTETQTELCYSQLNVTSLNKIICKKKFKQIHRFSYEDLDDQVGRDEINVCIFDYNPKKCKIKLKQTIKNLNVNEILINKKDKKDVIIITNENDIYYL